MRAGIGRPAQPGTFVTVLVAAAANVACPLVGLTLAILLKRPPDTIWPLIGLKPDAAPAPETKIGNPVSAGSSGASSRSKVNGAPPVTVSNLAPAVMLQVIGPP